MAKNAFVNARVESKLKKEAEAILSSVGVKTSDAVTMFFRQIVIQQGLPFSVCTRSHVPNTETQAAVDEARALLLRGQKSRTIPDTSSKSPASS